MWNAKEALCRLNKPNSLIVHVEAIKVEKDMLYVQFTNINTKAFHFSLQKCVIQLYSRTVLIHTLISFRYLVGCVIGGNCHLNINSGNAD